MNIEQIKGINIKESNIKELIAENRNIVLNDIQEKFNCNRTVAEYLLFNSLTYHITSSEVIEHICYLDEIDLF